MAAVQSGSRIAGADASVVRPLCDCGAKDEYCSCTITLSADVSAVRFAT